MAAKTEDVYIRIKLDSSGAAPEVHSLTDAMAKLQARMESLRKAGKSDNDSEVQFIARQMANVDTLIKQNRQWFKDIEAIMSHLLDSTTKELKAALKQLNKEMNDLTRKGGDVTKIAEVQERTNRIQGELNRRNAQARALSIDIKNLTKLTADELKRATDQAGALVKTLPKGTAEMRQTLSMYQRFRERQEKVNGEMSLGVASRLATGSKKGTLSQLVEAGKYLKQYKEDWGQFMNDTMGKKMDDRIQNITKRQLDMARSIASGSTKASYQDMQAALQIIKNRWESLDPSVKKNQTLIHDLGLEYEKLKANVDAWGSATMTKADAGNVLAQSLRLLKQGADADANAVAHYIEQLKLAEKAEGITIANQNQLYAARKKLTDLQHAEAPANARPLADIFKDIDSAKSLEQLERLRDELKSVFRTLTDDGEIKAARAKFDQLDVTIKNFGQETVDAFAVLRDPKNYNLSQVTAAIKQLEEKFNNIKVGPTFDSLRQKYAADIQTLKDYKEAAEAALRPATMSNADAVGFAKGGNGTVAQLREAVKVLEEFREKSLQTSDTTQLATYNKYISDLKKRIDDATKSVTQMDVQTAKWLANGSVTGTVAELKEAKTVLEAYKQTLATTDDAGLKQVNADLNKIDQILDKVNGKTKQVMNKTQAEDAVRNLNALIESARRNPDGVAADVMNDAIAAAKQAQSATGISIRLSQEAAAAERVATEVMRGKNAAVISATEATKAEANAQQILIDKEKADADTVRDTIELYKQMLLQGGMTIERRAQLSKQLEQMEKLYKGTADAASKLAYDEDFVNKTLANIKTAPIKDLETAMKMLKQKMSEVNRETEAEVKEYVRLRQEYNKTKSALDALNGTKQKAAKQTKTLSTRIKEQTDAVSRATGKLMQYLGVFGGFYLIRNQMEKVFEANMRYDDSLTNIRKTTQMTSEAVAVLANEIKHIDTRTSVEEMTNLAYAAGKLGVKGVSDVLSFVRAADQIKVALGEQLGDGAAAVEQIYKVANVMGDIDQYGMENALEKVGSSINYLTMQTQATAQPMIDMMKRLAGVGRQAGMSTADLVGWAGATNALGQNTELAATALSRVMVQLSKNHKAVAQALNMTEEETRDFRYDISTGRMSEAMLKVLQMGKERGGLSQLGLIIKDLSGSDGARAIQVLSTLSSSYETVASMVRMSNNAFEEGTSVTEEYNLKQQNTTALLEKLKNGFAKLFTSTEYVDYINKLLRSMQDLPEAANRIVHSLSWLGSIFKNFITILTNAQALFEGLANGLVWRMISQGAITLGGALVTLCRNVGTLTTSVKWHTLALHTNNEHAKRLTKGYTGWSLVVRKARLETAAFTKTLRAMGTAGVLNVIFLVTSAITLLWQGIKNLREESQKWTRSFNEDLGRIEAQSKVTTASLNKIEKAWKDAGDSELQHRDILIELNSTYGAFIDNLIDEKTGYEEIAKAIKAANAELENKAILEARQNKINEIEEENADKLNDNINSSLKRIVRLAKFVREIEETDENGNVTTKTVTVGHDQMTADEKMASAAAVETAVQTLLADKDLVQSLYMVSKRDKDLGRAEEYGVGLRGTTAELAVTPEALNKLKVLFKDLGIADTQSNWKEVLFAMNDAVNTQTKTLNLQDDAMRAYNSKAQVKTNPTYQDTMDLVKESWLDVVDSVTKNGTYAFSRYSAEDEEVKKGTKKEGEAKPYHGKEQDNYYSDVKEAFGTTRKGLEERKELSTKLERFIENAQRGISLLESRRYTDAAAQQRYEQLSYQLQSAQAEYKVVGIGKIDNVTPPGGNPARDARQEMDNLIQKIKTFYEIQANAYKEMRQKQQITETEYQRYLEQNNRDMSASLADAYAALAQDADMTEERYKQITERMRQENKRSGAGEIGETQIGIVSGTSYASVQNINKQLSGDKENGTAWTNSMRRKRREEEGNVIESLNKEAEEVSKAWLEQNPLGKLSKQFQEELEKLRLMFADFGEDNRGVLVETAMVDEDGNTIFETYTRSLKEMQDDVMAAYHTIGENAFKFDVTTDKGIEAFRNYVRTFPDLSAKAAKASATELQTMYYLSYEYAEQYQEQIQKLAEKQMRVWKKMFDASDVKLQSDAMQKAISELMKQQERMTKYGFSDRHQLDSNVELQREKLTQATIKYYELKQKAEAQMAAAQALNIGDMDGNVKVDDDYKQKKIDQAQGVIDQMKKQAEEVNQIYQSLGDAIMAVQDKNLEFLASLSQSFDKFADAFTPLREFYDDRDDWWEHIFGSKEERQNAFASFVMDLKKTTKEMIMEDVRQRITAVMNEKMKQKQLQGVRQAAYTEEQVQERVNLAVKEALGQQEVSTKQGVVQQEMQLEQQQHTQEMKDTADDVTGKGAGFIAKAIGWCYEHLGPIGGSIAAGVVTAAIGTAINWALNMIGHQSHGLNSGNATKMKLVSGMLTYDAGNVQSFPVMGDDGRVYMASRGGVPASGTGMVTRPTLTTVGGAPALVAERGPEMVIGRETTHAMMMSRPDLLRAIVEFDRNRSRGFVKTFDSGNIGSINNEQLTMNNEGGNTQLMEVLDAQTAMLSQMYEINAALTAELRKGIGVRKYGAGGLIEETAAGFAEARRLGNNKNVTRLFGSR